MIRDEVFIFVNGVQVMILEVVVFCFESGVCVDDLGVMLVMAVSGVVGFELIIWGEGEGVLRVGLNHQVVSVVRAVRCDGVCLFVLLDVLGVLYVIMLSKYEYVIVIGFVVEVSVCEELIMGLSFEYSLEWIFVMDMVNWISILEFEDCSVW